MRNSTLIKWDLTWGESVAVREAFLLWIKRPFTPIDEKSLKKFNYSPFLGDETLLKHTREVIKRQVGFEYKHVFLTNGAAGGCTISLRALKQLGYNRVITNPPPFFSIYPNMIMASGLIHDRAPVSVQSDIPVNLIDSPSNPLGENSLDTKFGPVIWDAVYGNRVYTPIVMPIKHDVLVGSYSKLTGLNGIRIGWIATDDDALASIMASLITAEYCGLSVPSIMILNNILPNYKWDMFEASAKQALDTNRYEWSKLEKFFGGEPVKNIGMFYYGPMDAACKKLFAKANVIWTPGSKLGHNDDFGRFNIGASLMDIRLAVQEVLRKDLIK